MAGQLLTKPGTVRLSEIARKVAVPSGITSTGWPAVRDKCAELGISFRPWQPSTGQVILAKRADGKYAATIGGTGLSIPRQVGKTFLVGAIVFALCLLCPNLTVIWTAHRLRTAEETFKKMQGFARRKMIAPHILKVIRGSGDEEIQFHNGSRILFGARERGFGRGFDEVDVLIFDEAQILSDNALDDMIPATNQSRQPTGALLLFMGTPPKPTDPGDVFRRMRTEALSGEDQDTGWIEFGADPDFEPTLSPAPLNSTDWAQIGKANPSYPQDTPREAILRMRKKLGAESFLREGLGIWGEEDKAGAFSFESWKALSDPQVERGDSPVFAVATDPDRTWAAIAVAWTRPDGHAQVMLTSDADGSLDYRPNTAWVQGRVDELRQRWRSPVLLDTASKGLVLDAEVQSESDQAVAQNALYDRVIAATVHHENQSALSMAVKGSRWKNRGNTRVLERRGSIDISPLVAAALAVHGLGAARPSVYEDRELLSF